MESFDWSRTEVSRLSGLSTSQLDYLNRIELIKPKRIGDKRAIVLYSWGQLLVLRAYAKLREQCSLQALRDAVKYLGEHPEKLLVDKRLVAFENEIFWIDDTESDVYKTVTLSGKNKGQMIMSFTLQDLVNEVFASGKDNIIDFEKRFKNSIKAA